MDSTEILDSTIAPFAKTELSQLNMQEDVHQLIVIGNGFDLACGLPSSYGSFFKDVHQRVFPDPEAVRHIPWGEHLQKHNLTVWDVILCGKDADTNWYDVESEIRRWVLDNSGRSIGRIDKVQQLLSGRGANIPGYASLPDYWSIYTGGPLRGYPEADVARFIMDVTPDYDTSNWSRRRILGIMLGELHKLEDRFANYLLGAIHETKQYAPNASRLLKRLEGEGLSPNHHSHCTILNFNYTTSWPLEGADLLHDAQMVNIHGRIEDKNTIFGIDGSDCLEYSYALPFTKTYRIMDEGTGDVADIVYSPNSGRGKATTIIKFFGHSLSRADYSYFQAIFDVVDLYNGNTRLIFYYRPHGDLTDAKARGMTMQRVTRLLCEYGKTLDNKDHGKNLVHRLLLERRLRVQRI